MWGVLVVLILKCLYLIIKRNYCINCSGILINKTKTSKQNIIGHTEIKDKQTVMRGEVGEDNGEKGGRVFGNMYKGHMDKAKA